MPGAHFGWRGQRSLPASGISQEIVRCLVTRNVQTVPIMGDEDRGWRGIEEGREFGRPFSFPAFALPQRLLGLFALGDIASIKIGVATLGNGHDR